jgi:predicted nuclease of predicted toxin-antitoxin system
MKLLFDQNISHRLVRRLADIYPDSIHVREVGLRDAGDAEIWEYARLKGFTIVSKHSVAVHTFALDAGRSHLMLP